jgi:hypothetical protein
MQDQDLIHYLLRTLVSFDIVHWEIYCLLCFDCLCTIYNMSGRVVSDIQTRAEGESLYIRYNADANVVNNLKNGSSYEFIGKVILKINVV